MATEKSLKASIRNAEIVAREKGYILIADMLLGALEQLEDETKPANSQRPILRVLQGGKSE